MEITMKKAGLIYVAILLVLTVGYYSTLSPQDEFLRDLRWVSDKSAINLGAETEAIALYVYTTDEIKEFLTKNYKISNNTKSEPIGSKQDYLDELQKYRAAAIANGSKPLDSVNTYFDYLEDVYFDSEVQYNAALVDINLELTVQHLTKLSPTIPPIVTSTEDITIEVVALAVNIDDLWKIKMFAEVDDGEYVLTDKSIQRYIKD